MLEELEDLFPLWEEEDGAFGTDDIEINEIFMLL
jgi:hypothetical protein